jgi:hypothetical protein
LTPFFEKVNAEKIISYLKIEVDDGMERALVYSILDAGFRPGLFCVKWAHDVDEHIHTAHCVGHMINCGYRLIKFENGYSLYYFTDDNLYDTCSVKDYTLYNPFIKNISDVLNKRYQDDVKQYLTSLGLAKTAEPENNSETKVDEGSS